jgi:hypothetical protein
VTDALLAAGFAAGVLLVAFGVWLAYRPAGFLAAAVALLATVVFYVRGRAV